jgi:DNA-binding NtrC family response regulator
MFAARILSFPTAPPAFVERSHLEAALATVDAALAVIEADDRTRWTVVLRRFRNFVLWHRAAVIEAGAWQMASPDGELCPVSPDDPALALADRQSGDGACWIAADPALPAGARGALIARYRHVTLYFEMGLDRDPPRKIEQQLVLHVLALLAALGYGAVDGADSPSAGLVGESAPMRSVFDLLRRHADSRAPVYIYGETGTGKEQIARALHAGSPRRGGPFVPVNASAVSEGVFESELFGHVKGSFTGAVINREGYVGLAHGGTLFLDEIADLSPSGQAKLLRFLEDGEYRRVGESQTRRADVRVVAASNVPLEARVAKGTFRQDLLYRLKVLALRLPPLRARHGDVVPLARHLLREAATAEGKSAPRLSESAWTALESYHWPGNVRELRSEMYRVVVEHAGGLVRARDLSPGLQGQVKAPCAARLDAASAEFERGYIEAMLAECRGHRSMAARRLGISRQGLRGKMKRYGIA